MWRCWPTRHTPGSAPSTADGVRSARQPATEVRERGFDRANATKLKHYSFGRRVAATDVTERGVEGTVLNMGSISATVAKPEQIVHGSTTGPIRTVTRSAALELTEHGIRVRAGRGEGS